MEYARFGLQISRMPVRLWHLQYGNTVWLMWRRSGRWWLKHDWPGTTEAYPSSFFPFHRRRRRKKKAPTPLLHPDVSTNNHLKSVNNPPCWGENYFKDLQGAKGAYTNTGALSRWGEFEKGSARGNEPLELTSDSNLYSWRRDSDDGSPTGSSRATTRSSKRVYIQKATVNYTLRTN